MIEMSSVATIIIIIIFIYLPSDVIAQKKLHLPLGLSPKYRNMQFLLKPTHKLAESKRYLVTW